MPDLFDNGLDEVYWDGMVECVERGIVANVGVSNYGSTLLRRAHKHFKERGVDLAANQIHYSLLYNGKSEECRKTAEEVRRGEEPKVTMMLVSNNATPQQTPQTPPPFTASFTAVSNVISNPSFLCSSQLGVTTFGYQGLAMGLLTGSYNKYYIMKNLSSYGLTASDGYRLADVDAAMPFKFKKNGRSFLETRDLQKYAATSGVDALVAEMVKVGVKHGKTVAQVAVNYCVAKGVVPIVGCR